MKNKIIIAGTLLSGILIGVIGYDILISNSFSYHRQYIRVLLSVEEEFRASREERKGNHLTALFHQWNAARFTNPDSLRVFSKEMHLETDNSWFAPFAFSVLEKVAISANPGDKGYKAIEAIQRGHLAYQMEQLGFTELATQEWERAANLSKVDLGKWKSRIIHLRKSSDDELTKAAEDSVLGPDT